MVHTKIPTLNHSERCPEDPFVIMQGQSREGSRYPGPHPLYFACAAPRPGATPERRNFRATMLYDFKSGLTKS